MMPTGCERPISATAMPTKPAPCDEVELHAALLAHDRIQRHHAGQRTGDHHGDDGDAASRNAGVDARPTGCAPMVRIS